NHLCTELTGCLVWFSGQVGEEDLFSSSEPAQLTMKFLSTVTQTIRHLGLVPLCPFCSNCGWPVFYKNVQFRRDDVERSLNGERNLGFSLPRLYCRKCMNELGVEPVRYQS